MKTSRIPSAAVAASLALAGLAAVSVSLRMGSVDSLLGYCAVATVVALVIGDYRLGTRRLVPVK